MGLAEDYTTRDATALADLVQQRQVSPAELVEAAIARLEQVEPKLAGMAEWALDRTTGGSSGGSAAHVAVRSLPMAHAADGGGSIRIPASCRGLFGLKPTRGRTPKGPYISEGWHGAATGHAVTRSVPDSARLLDAIAGPDLGSPYGIAPPTGSFTEAAARPPERLRIAFSAIAPNGAQWTRSAGRLWRTQRSSMAS